MESLYCINKLCSFAVWLLVLISFSSLTSSEASNPKGNITIKWDVISWTPDGYVAVVTIYNLQKQRQIRAPGWRLGWRWMKKEVIWSMVGGQALYQGDCSMFIRNIPHSCKRDPTIVDLPRGTPFDQQIANCCKGGVLDSNSASSFQLSVGRAGTTNRTVSVPRNFTFKAPGQAYVCGPPRIVKPTRFLSEDRRRVTQALMTWNDACFAREHE